MRRHRGGLPSHAWACWACWVTMYCVFLSIVGLLPHTQAVPTPTIATTDPLLPSTSVPVSQSRFMVFLQQYAHFAIAIGALLVTAIVIAIVLLCPCHRCGGRGRCCSKKQSSPVIHAGAEFNSGGDDEVTQPTPSAVEQGGAKQVDPWAPAAQRGFRHPSANLEDLLAFVQSPYCPQISTQRVHVGASIGSGEFGEVHRATYQEFESQKAPFPTVMVRVLKRKGDAAAKVKLLQEAAIGAQFCHPSILRLLGVVTDSKPFPSVVWELAERGPLDRYLRHSEVEQETLVNMAQDIVDGMHYLACCNFVVGNLTAHGVLVTRKQRCKLSDLGLHRNVSDPTNKAETINVRWCSPELLPDPTAWRQSADSGLLFSEPQCFTKESDVFAFGVVLWELFSLGELPFQELSDKEIIKNVKRGHRLPAPPRSSKDIYKIMMACWTPDPTVRPSFEELQPSLKQIRSNPASVLPSPQGTLSGLERAYVQSSSTRTVSPSTATSGVSSMQHDGAQRHVKTAPRLHHSPLVSTGSVARQSVQAPRAASPMFTHIFRPDEGETGVINVKEAENPYLTILPTDGQQIHNTFPRMKGQFPRTREDGGSEDDDASHLEDDQRAMSIPDMSPSRSVLDAGPRVPSSPLKLVAHADAASAASNPPSPLTALSVALQGVPSDIKQHSRASTSTVATLREDRSRKALSVDAASQLASMYFSDRVTPYDNMHFGEPSEPTAHVLSTVPRHQPTTAWAASPTSPTQSTSGSASASPARSPALSRSLSPSRLPPSRGRSPRASPQVGKRLIQLQGMEPADMSLELLATSSIGLPTRQPDVGALLLAETAIDVDALSNSVILSRATPTPTQAASEAAIVDCTPGTELELMDQLHHRRTSSRQSQDRLRQLRRQTSLDKDQNGVFVPETNESDSDDEVGIPRTQTSGNSYTSTYSRTSANPTQSPRMDRRSIARRNDVQRTSPHVPRRASPPPGVLP
eukprot:m.362279 g.362279  ORF g.362279 m.362279 type:complete len:974 (+) comp20279_c0_seq1:155-3076(+)